MSWKGPYSVCKKISAGKEFALLINTPNDLPALQSVIYCQVNKLLLLPKKKEKKKKNNLISELSQQMRELRTFQKITNVQNRLIGWRLRSSYYSTLYVIVALRYSTHKNVLHHNILDIPIPPTLPVSDLILLVPKMVLIICTEKKK